MESYQRETTPFLKDFGTGYANAVSAAPWTFPSVPSLLTGKYPHEHGATFTDNFRNFDTGNLPGALDDKVYTLSELFAGSGYDTYFSSAIVTASLPINGRFGQIHVNHNASAERMINDFMNWWKSCDNRFGYLHLGDLHQPLHIPDKQPFGVIDEGLESLIGWDFRNESESNGDFEYYREQRVKLYDTILAEVDRQIERLIEFLRTRDELEETIVVVVGDHGEEFWEHAAREYEQYHDPRGFYGVGHGHSLFEPAIRVPLIFHFPSEISDLPQRISTVEIAPRILREAIVRSDNDVLRHVGTDFEPDSDIILSEGIGYGYDKKSLYKGDYKLIHSINEEETDFLFDLSEDPSEKTNLNDTDRIIKLMNLLPNKAKHTGDEVNVNSEARDRLEDLGYI
ncbi:sulfatase family protein [Haladaptatus salinisoli]|uniref:sulfatase family protein n=1 Tax=Haladaptatus salinisoli TaxID=2884876 RepID=UPI002107A0E7|nr:sulfatase-like hydrolase/transferase [Haladaptatus salinisoli]